MNRYGKLLYLTCLTLFFCTSAAADSWLFRSVNLLDIEAGEFIEKQNVLVRDGKIVQIGRITTTDKITVIDATDKFLVPGYTEMHAHVRPSRVSNAERDRLLFLYNAHGITTIRGMLGHPLHLTMREQLAKGEIAGPRLITSGPSFNRNSVISPEQAAGRTLAQFEKGYDFIKVHPGMSDAEFRAMADKANELGFDYSGHITAETGILNSVEIGQGTIEHLDGLFEELSRRSGNKDLSKAGFFGIGLVDSVDQQHIVPLAQELARSSVYMVPTQSMMWGFISPEDPNITAEQPQYKLMTSSNMDNWKSTRRSIHNSPDYSKAAANTYMAIRLAFLKAYIGAGGKVLLGSDAPQMFNVPGDSLHDEMRWMRDAGMSAIDILRSTTIAPAKFFKRDKEFGSIQIGKSADLVLLSANPLADISNARKIAGVMTRGQWLSKADIDARLATIRRP